MQSERNKRPRGTGCLYTRRDVAGRETWYAKWYVGNRPVKRKIGVKRERGKAEGWTKKEAEGELRRLLDQAVRSPRRERVTVETAGARLLAHLEGLGRKPATLEGYESALRVHLVPFFAGLSLESIGPELVEGFISQKGREGLSAKSTLNYLGFLHSIFEFAQRRGWASSNPCKLVDKPAIRQDNPEILFLDQAEVEALLRIVPSDSLGRVERVMYLAAAMTGLRQGELIALRWRDVDWPAARVRVRRNYVRGEYGTPKSKRSSRSVPLADRVAGDLDRLNQASGFRDDDDLVFGHPVTGRPLDRSKLLKRFKAALRVAEVREVRFHDLRHTFGTRMAAAGVPLRTIQEWMGHRDYKTTLIYADYAPSAREAEWVEAAFRSEDVERQAGATV